MSTKTFSPSSDVSAGCDRNGGSSNYGNMADSTDDNYVYSSTGAKTDEYGVNANDIPTGSTSITLKLYTRMLVTETMDAYVQPRILLSGVAYPSTSRHSTVGSTWETIEDEYATNPATSTAWAAEDFDDLTLGVVCSVMDTGSGDAAEATKQWAEVVYTAPVVASAGAWIFG